MAEAEFVGKSNIELLQLHARVLDELRRRDVLRSKNNPIGDYAEWLVATRLGMKLELKSTAGFDAVDIEGTRFQIKARRITADNGSRQLSIIRNLDRCLFDSLIAILFRADYSIMSAYAIPHEVIADYAKFKKHTNGHILHLQGSLLVDDRVQEITSKLA